MSTINPTPWYEAYRRVAEQLYHYYSEYLGFSDINLFDKLYSSEEFRRENPWFENVIRSGLSSVDPIQMFASFSGSSLNPDTRTRRINALLLALDNEAEVYTDIDFDGCPVPVTINLLRVRDADQQREIWDAFAHVMNEKKEELSEYYYNQARSWYGIQTQSFTIFLFWVDPDRFIPLDKWTLNYLVGTQKLDSNKVTYDQYVHLLHDPDLKDIKTYVKKAYHSFTDVSAPEEEPVLLNEFRILALRTLEHNPEHHKILKEKSLYIFDRQYSFPDGDDYFNDRGAEEVNREEERIALYRTGENKVRINISAVVGKNGSGKSTLMDLIAMGIYNLSLQKEYITVDDDGEVLEPLKDLNFELYFVNRSLYKLVFTDTVELFEFKQDGNTFRIGQGTQHFNADKLFYGVMVNYSHYALNSKDHRPDWITPLSHKNDGYLTPLVINPQRTEGNININRERSLLNSRLLLNLLELYDRDKDISESFRYIGEGKYFQYFRVELDGYKIDKVERVLKKYGIDDTIKETILEVIGVVFNINRPESLSGYLSELENYVIYKLISICSKYRKYREQYWKELSGAMTSGKGLSKIITDIANELKDDRSHITEKLKQAVNCLRFPDFFKELLVRIPEEYIDLDKYYTEVTNVMSRNAGENLELRHLLPPPIFQLEFFLQDKSSFSKASSGEFQVMGGISSILYHIRNIDSVEEDEFSSKFNFVNVFFDEIELYFHPDLQRQFIHRLHNNLTKLETMLNYVIGINLIFLTHSPFILSDIPESKVLKVKGGLPQEPRQYNSFGANIHDLLADEFFMEEGSMGAFARSKIKQAIALLNGEAAGEQDRMYIKELIDIVGEPVIKHTLMQMYDKKFKQKLEIEFLEEKLKALKENNNYVPSKEA